jgi:hypothetical protein
MHICSGAQIKIEYVSEYSISVLFQTILHFESWSLYCIMFFVCFCVMVNWNNHWKYNGFSLFKWKLQVCKLGIYILGFIDISKCSCFVLLKNNVAFYSCLPFPRTWVVCETIVKLLSPIMTSYVLNQDHGHWLLGKCLAFL